MMVQKKLYILFIVVCASGFMYQALEISLQYFSYKTTTKVFLQIDTHFNNPSVIFCSRYTDILDRSNYQKYGINPTHSYHSKDWGSDMAKLTIQDIFDLTPDPEKVIQGCQYREHDYDLTSYNASECQSFFRVQKYHEGRYICYAFMTRNPDDKFKCHRIARSFYSEGEMYSVTLNPVFMTAHCLQLISFMPGHGSNPDSQVPYASRRFFKPFYRFSKTNSTYANKSESNYFYVSGDAYLMKRMALPYDTRCTKHYKESVYACRESCNIQAFKSFNLFPPNEISVNPTSIKHLSLVHLSNKSLIDTVREENNRCLVRCKQQLCFDRFSVTQGFVEQYTRLGSVSISSRCSSRPIVAIHFLPNISIWDYIIYIGSSIGIWFGLSVHSFIRKAMITKHKSNTKKKHKRNMHRRLTQLKTHTAAKYPCQYPFHISHY